MFWIPLIGPIIQGISSIFTGYFNQNVQLKQAEVQETIGTAQVSEKIIKDTHDDIALKIMRDMMVLPICVWSMLIGWDTIIANQSWARDWMWHVATYPPSVAFLPYVVIVFLFGNIGLNMWRNK